MKLFVSIRHLSNIGGRLYYKRRFPLDLKDRLGPGAVWKYALGLKSGEELQAKKLVEELGRKHDKEIKRLREHRTAKPLSQNQIYKEAVEFAERALLFVQAPEEYPEATTPRDQHREKLITELGKRARADGYEQQELEELNRQDRLEDVLAEYMTEEEATLEQVLVAGGIPIPSPLTLDYILEYEKEMHGSLRRDNKGYELAVEQFNEFRLEHEFMTIQRREIRGWINHLREVRGQNGETVGKRVTALATMVGHFFDDHDVEKRNPFAGIRVPRGGVATEKKLADQLGISRRSVFRIKASI